MLCPSAIEKAKEDMPEQVSSELVELITRQVIESFNQTHTRNGPDASLYPQSRPFDLQEITGPIRPTDPELLPILHALALYIVSLHRAFDCHSENAKAYGISRRFKNTSLVTAASYRYER